MGSLVQALARGWRGKGGRTGLAERMRWRREGDAARDARNWAAAVHAYEMHLNQAPQDHTIWVQYGHALKEAGSLVRALAAYEQGKLLNPADKDVALHLDHLRRRLGEDAALAPGLQGARGTALPGAGRPGTAFRRELGARAARPTTVSLEAADAGLVAARLGDP